MPPQRTPRPPVTPGFPAFDLYGEAQPRPRLEPVHLEPLVTRSALHQWKIRPHRHRALFQLFWIRQGGGELLQPASARPFQAPALLLIPPGQVHGFRHEPASAGQVLTLADGFLAACGTLAGDVALPAGPAILPLAGHDGLAPAVEAAFAGLDRAFRSPGAERHAALAGHVLLLLSLLQRGLQHHEEGQPGAAQARLLRRFREDLELHYTAHAGLAAHCARLGVTQSTLNRACRAITGQSPLALIHARLMAEARRMLVHGPRNVAGVAYALGFEPAYFSRFFTRHEGLSPAAYQRRHGG